METSPLLDKQPLNRQNSHKLSNNYSHFPSIWNKASKHRRVSHIINKSDDFSPSVLMPDMIESSWGHRIAFFVDSTPIGRMWEIFDAFTNLAFCAVYIWNTRMYSSSNPSPGNDHVGLPPLQRNLDFFLALLLLLQFIPRNLIAVDTRRFIFSVLSVLTYVATIPVFLSFIDPRTRDEFMSAGWYAYFYPFRFMRLHLAIIVCLVPSKTSILKVSLITRKAIRLLGFLLFLFLTVAAFLHVGTHMSDNVNDVSFFDAFYYAFVSATSGSASQIIPDSPFSRMIIVGVIISAAVFVPTNLAELLRLISNKSAYDHSFKEKSGQNHVVVCGQFEVGSLHTFLKEFFCPDHGTITVNTHVVILGPNEPGEELKMILEDPMYLNRVQYVIGTVMNPRSIEKVRMHEANACFVFSSKYATADATQDDAATVMRALAVKKQIPGVPLHVQVLLPEHKVHFDYLADSMVCIEELKLGLLAQNCRCPGFTTLMHMLTTSITEQNAKSILSSIADAQSKEWVTEYLEGANQEIYPTVLSSGFEGRKFTDVSALIYSQFGAVTIGIGIPNSSYHRKIALRERLDELLKSKPTIVEQVDPDMIKMNASDFELLINPGSYVVSGGEVAFIVASEDEIAQNIAEYCPSDIVNMFDEMTDSSRIRELLRSDANGSSSKVDAIPELFDRIGDDKKLRSPSRPNFKNHRITSNKDKADISVDVKQLLKGETVLQTMSDPTSPNVQENLIIPSQTPTQLDGIPTSLFSAGSSSLKDSFDDVMNSKETRTESGLVSRILSQAIGFQGVITGRRRYSTVTSDEGSSVQSSFHIRDHILVCDASSTFPANLEYFIAPLRAPHLKGVREDSAWASIVILSPAEPSFHQRSILEQFDDVHIVKGNPIVRKDLLRAAVDRCKKAVVLANSTKGKHLAERTADADSLLTVLNIEAMTPNKDLFVVTECIHDENMAFIGPSGLEMKKTIRERHSKTLLRPSFMSGHVYSQSMLDTLICQNYFNPHMLNIVRHMLFSGSFTNKTSDEEATHSHVWLVPLPEKLSGARYADLFSYFVSEYDAIPLGLYRDTHLEKRMNNSRDATSSLLNNLLPGSLYDSLFEGDDKAARVERVKHRYVYLNPEPSTRIRKHDAIYILSHKPVSF